MSTPAAPYDFTFPDHQAVILPLAIDGDFGIYSEEQLTLKKGLAEAGIDVDYLHDSDHRRWLGLHGADVVAEIVIGLATSGAVAAIQHLLTRTPRRVRVRAARKTNPDGSKIEWFDGEGDSGEVSRALGQFFEQTPDDDDE